MSIHNFSALPAKQNRKLWKNIRSINKLENMKFASRCMLKYMQQPPCDCIQCLHWQPWKSIMAINTAVYQVTVCSYYYIICFA